MYDIVIVGAGPAGLTAAIYARRANKSVLLLDKGAFGGQITFSPKVENYPGFASCSGSELADAFVEQVLAQGADVEVENVVEIREGDGNKVVVTEEGSEYEVPSFWQPAPVTVISDLKMKKNSSERESPSARFATAPSIRIKPLL